MQRKALIMMVLFLGLTTLLAQDAVHKKTTCAVSTGVFDVAKEPFDHPQQLTPKQTSRILSIIRLDDNTPVLTTEEINELAPKISVCFAKVSKDQQVILIKSTGDLNDDGTMRNVQKLVLRMCFLNPDSLSIALVSQGISPEPRLRRGHFMRWKKNSAGIPVFNTLLLRKALWTSKFQTPVFDAKLNSPPTKLTDSPQKGHLLPNSRLSNQEKQPTQETPTMSIEQLEKELKRLTDMKSKGLITDEEFQKAREKLIEEAGIKP